MCAIYGLDGALLRRGWWGIAPLDERVNLHLLTEWVEGGGGTARITGANALNLNPIITAPAGERRLDLGWWWLHLGGRPAPFSAFNSRDDRLTSRWRGPFQRRGLLPASWYVEKRVPFGLPDGGLFAMAAITTAVPRPDREPLVTYSLVTREAVGPAARVHHRMPLIVPGELHDTWLDPERPGDEDLAMEVVEGSWELSAAARPRPRGGSPGAGTDQGALF